MNNLLAIYGRGVTQIANLRIISTNMYFSTVKQPSNYFPVTTCWMRISHRLALLGNEILHRLHRRLRLQRLDEKREHAIEHAASDGIRCFRHCAGRDS